MSVFPDCHAFLVLQYSQHIATERSFSRLPTHPYAQWWNVTFITINNSSFLPFSVSEFTTVRLKAWRNGLQRIYHYFPFRAMYSRKCSSIPSRQHYSYIIFKETYLFLLIFFLPLKAYLMLLLL